jgi:hypothetical protein
MRTARKQFVWTEGSEAMLRLIVDRQGMSFRAAVALINQNYPQRVPVTVCACIGKLNRMRKADGCRHA